MWTGEGGQKPEKVSSPKGGQINSSVFKQKSKSYHLIRYQVKRKLITFSTNKVVQTSIVRQAKQTFNE